MTEISPALARKIAQTIAEEIGAQTQQVQAAVALLDEGATVPFIARYRKEVTGGLDDTQLRNLEVRLAYLREMEDKYGATYQAIAAYNAGPTPVARWLAQRPSHDPDLWIETITYKETRDYVARVLAFSVIYDWRLNGDALPVTDRMNGRLQVKRKTFACAANADKGGD